MRINIYIVSKINKNFPRNCYPTQENCMFSEVSSSKNDNIAKCKNSGYDIGYYRKGTISSSNGFGRGYIIFGVDMSSSLLFDEEKKKNENPTRGLDGTTFTVKKYIQLSLLKTIRNFV